MSTGHIFNVPEAHGKRCASHVFPRHVLDEPSYRAVELETTAAEAQLEAPTSKIAREIEENAEHVHDVAKDAADAAR
ncbi:hypothetical protein C0992_002409, partial [Termitomyces sp. T32_za158]